VQIGISFPTTTIGTDAGTIRDYIQAVEGAGFDHLTALDHVLGAHIDRFTIPIDGRSTPPYTDESEIHEVFALLAFAAGITSRLQLTTSILVLPQRQTQLVAKQAAEVDLVSGGRLRVGIGVGWNYAEFEAMGADFHTRGRRAEEQIEVLRLLWTQPLVQFSGRWHQIDRLSINPRPIQQPIPIWIGSSASERLMRRVARLADGWMPQQTGDQSDPFADTLDRLREYTNEAGRDPDAIGIEVRLSASLNDPGPWLRRAGEMQELGISHITLSTSRDARPPSDLVADVSKFRGLLSEVVPA
jgi:probable F420-dependent oxidoreductase